MDHCARTSTADILTWFLHSSSRKLVRSTLIWKIVSVLVSILFSISKNFVKIKVPIVSLAMCSINLFTGGPRTCVLSSGSLYLFTIDLNILSLCPDLRTISWAQNWSISSVQNIDHIYSFLTSNSGSQQQQSNTQHGPAIVSIGSWFSSNTSNRGFQKLHLNPESSH